MKRTPKEGAVRCFEYGADAPSPEDERLIDEQLFLCNKLWNSLVEVEETFRNAYDALREAYPMPDGAKRRTDPAYLQAYAELEATRKAGAALVYQQRGPLFGTFADLIKRNYDTQHGETIKKGHRLKFHRFDHTGTLQARFKDPTTPDELAIKPISRTTITFPSEADLATRASRRKAQRTTFTLGLYNSERELVSAAIPVYLHRRLPEGTMILSINLNVTKVGFNKRYTITVTARYPEPKQRAKGRTLGIDVGWRVRPQGLRVAVLHRGSHTEELVIPHTLIDHLRKGKELESLIDVHFNETKAALLPFLPRFSPLVKERFETLAHWNSPKRLAGAFQFWEANRFRGDAIPFALLSEWFKRFRHLYEWHTNLEDQTLRSRREFYRVAVAKMLIGAHTVKVEDFDLRDVYEGEAKKEVPKAVAWNRYVAAISTFRFALKSACSREGVAYVEVPAAFTTMDCHSCGTRQDFNRADLSHTCVNCGKTWDQDTNAALNIRNSEAA